MTASPRSEPGAGPAPGAAAVPAAGNAATRAEAAAAEAAAAAGRPAPGGSGAFAPLAFADYRALWAASVVSNFGGLVQGVGAAWLMTQLTDSPTLIALVQASNTLPYMVFALLAGALADTLDRRRLMLAAQGAMAAISILLAVVGFAGGLTPWLLLALTFLLGTGGALYNPPWQASMGDLLPREQLPAAVTLNSVGFNVMRGVGPAAGGLVVAAWGAAAAFAVNALSYIPLLVALLRWRPPAQQRRGGREPLGPAVADGLRYVALSPNLLRVMGRGALFGFSAVSVLALLPLVAKAHPEGGSLLYGLLLGVYGVGAIGGAVLNPRLRARFDNETVVRLAFAGYALAALVLALAGDVRLQALGLLPAGASWVLALSLFNVSVQLSTPRWVVARALALYQTATFGGMAAGAWAWGALASLRDVPTALVVSAVLLGVGAVLGQWFRVPEFATVNLDPAGGFREPPLALDLRGRSGPLMIMVDYHIAQQDVPEFLALMARRRVIRRRDGARGWALLRDLEAPERWVESYHIETWDAYVRHNLRRTKSDAEITRALHALHRGAHAPPVHRMIERHSVSPADDLPLLGKLEVP